MSWLRPILAALTAGLVLAGPAAAADEATKGDPGAFAARPSPKAPQDKRGTYFRLRVERGTDRRQSVVIENLSRRHKHLLVDAVDGLTGTTSGSVYANRDDPRKQAGAWLTLPRKSVDLPPETTIRVPFSIAVPDGAAPGDHLAGIAIQDAHRTHSKSRLSITQIIRVVVGVQIIVEGPTQKALGLGKVSLNALPGTKVPSVVVHIANTGTELCKPRLDVTLAGADARQQLVSRKLDTILPGTAIDYPLPWPKALDAGAYEVGVQAKECGDAQAIQASAQLGDALRGTPDAPEPPPAATVIVQRSSIPWIGIVGLLAAVAILSAAAMALVMRRRRPIAR